MPAIYKSARLKIERAKKHAQDFTAAMIALEERSITTIKQQPDGGKSLTHEIQNLADGLDDLSLIAGDALHNLRASLDFAWVSTIERLLPDKLTSYTKFPMRESRQEFHNALHGIDIDTRCPALYDCLMRIEPYGGGNYSMLCTLHDLDISDKHLLLLGLDPVGQITGITIRESDGEVSRGSSMPARGMNGRYTIDFPPSTKIEEKGILSVAVTLQEAGIFKSVPVEGLLSDFRNVTFYTVQNMESV
jgi:hypothetical protein